LALLGVCVALPIDLSPAAALDHLQSDLAKWTGLTEPAGSEDIDVGVAFLFWVFPLSLSYNRPKQKLSVAIPLTTIG
jgi:hypothetical protein